MKRFILGMVQEKRSEVKSCFFNYRNEPAINVFLSYQARKIRPIFLACETTRVNRFVVPRMQKKRKKKKDLQYMKISTKLCEQYEILLEGQRLE